MARISVVDKPATRIGEGSRQIRRSPMIASKQIEKGNVMRIKSTIFANLLLRSLEPLRIFAPAAAQLKLMPHPGKPADGGGPAHCAIADGLIVTDGRNSFAFAPTDREL